MKRVPVELLIAAVLAFNAIALLTWWLPQKWAACQLLYSNRAAQLFCLGG
jgi:hypothetical protein